MPGTAVRLRAICSAATRDLPASGASVSVMASGGWCGLAAASDAASSAVEELQFTLGEGPCLDAFEGRGPILVADLARDGETRWPGYTAAALEQGVRAVFAFPLLVGSARLGALDVYRRYTGPLSAAAQAQAVSLAELVTATLLNGQENAAHHQGPSGLDDILDGRFEIHQAQGMVMVQLQVSLDEAMARIRAYAYARERDVGAVARDIVARRLTLDRDNQ